MAADPIARINKSFMAADQTGRSAAAAFQGRNVASGAQGMEAWSVSASASSFLQSPGASENATLRAMLRHQSRESSDKLTGTQVNPADCWKLWRSKVPPGHYENITRRLQTPALYLLELLAFIEFISLQCNFIVCRFVGIR